MGELAPAANRPSLGFLVPLTGALEGRSAVRIRSAGPYGDVSDTRRGLERALAACEAYAVERLMTRRHSAEELARKTQET